MSHLISSHAIGKLGRVPVSLGTVWHQGQVPYNVIPVAQSALDYATQYKQPDGSIRIPAGNPTYPQGFTLPAGASCPPDTAYDFGTGGCVSSPGTRNVNFECGGALAPWGQSPDCVIDPAPVAVPVPTVQPAPIVTPLPSIVQPSPPVVDSQLPPVLRPKHEVVSPDSCPQCEYSCPVQIGSCCLSPAQLAVAAIILILAVTN